MAHQGAEHQKVSLQWCRGCCQVHCQGFSPKRSIMSQKQGMNGFEHEMPGSGCRPRGQGRGLTHLGQ